MVTWGVDGLAATTWKIPSNSILQTQSLRHFHYGCDLPSPFAFAIAKSQTVLVPISARDSFVLIIHFWRVLHIYNHGSHATMKTHACTIALLMPTYIPIFPVATWTKHDSHATTKTYACTVLVKHRCLPIYSTYPHLAN